MKYRRHAPALALLEAIAYIRRVNVLNSVHPVTADRCVYLACLIKMQLWPYYSEGQKKILHGDYETVLAALMQSDDIEEVCKALEAKLLF